MPLTLAQPLSATLHALLARHGEQERNKERALALVESANRGEPCPLTTAFAPSGAAGRPLLACDSVLAEGDRVALRLTATTTPTPPPTASATAGEGVRCLLVQLRFDGAGHLTEFHAAPLPPAAR